MMAAAKYDITIEQGATFTLHLVYKTSGGTPIDLTGYSARMQIRPTVESATVMADLVSGTEITLGGAAGTIEIVIPETITKNITRSGVYDFELVDAATVYRLIEGTAYLSKGVTRD